MQTTASQQTATVAVFPGQVATVDGARLRQFVAPGTTGVATTTTPSMANVDAAIETRLDHLSPTLQSVGLPYNAKRFVDGGDIPNNRRLSARIY